MRLVAVGLILSLGVEAAIGAEKPVRFLNLTSETVTLLRLAPAGTKDFGADLTKGDLDGSVDHDERLPIKNFAPGAYDAAIAFKSGRSCIAKGVTIEAASVFSIEEKDLASCTK